MAIAITDVVAVMVTTFVTMQIKNILKDDWWKDMLPVHPLCKYVADAAVPIDSMAEWRAESGVFQSRSSNSHIRRYSEYD